MEKNLLYTNSPDGGNLLDTINKKERLYQVPAAYFEGLADEIMAKITTNQYVKAMAYHVPDGYFAGFAGQVLNRIKSANSEGVATKISAERGNFQNEQVYQELAEIAPFLLSIGNQNVYQAPKGYFAGLDPLVQISTANAVKRVSGENDTEGKIIPLTPRKKIWRSAVAAAAILTVLISGERYFNHNKNTQIIPSSANQYAATIPSGSDSFQQDLSGLSNLEIVNYLNTPDPSRLDSLSEKAAVETQRAISDMTNEELESYLDRTPATY